MRINPDPIAPRRILQCFVLTKLYSPYRSAGIYANENHDIARK